MPTVYFAVLISYCTVLLLLVQHFVFLVYCHGPAPHYVDRGYVLCSKKAIRYDTYGQVFFEKFLYFEFRKLSLNVEVFILYCSSSVYLHTSTLHILKLFVPLSAASYGLVLRKLIERCHKKRALCIKYRWESRCNRKCWDSFDGNGTGICSILYIC